MPLPAYACMQCAGVTAVCALQSWLPARALVQQAIEGRHEVDPSGAIIKLPVAGCPWKEHLAQLEEEQQLGDTVKFCLYEVSCQLASDNQPPPPLVLSACLGRSCPY